MAGEYIEFNNNSQPALNDTNINRLQQLIKQDIQGAVSGDTLPVGAIMPFGSDTIPENWLLCNGQAVSRTDYQELFNIIGITYGSGDGFTTFNLPDLQGKIPVGLDENDTDFNTLGNTGGEKEHTLTINEMPTHNHHIAVRNNNTTGIYETKATNATGDLGDAVTANEGGNQPHNILQPYIVQNYIIKAKQSAGVVATVVDGLNSTSATDALSANQGKVLKELIEGTVLYENSNGGNPSNGITLNDEVENYSRIKVFYGKATSQGLNSVETEISISKYLSCISYILISSAEAQLLTSKMYANGNSLTQIDSHYLNISSSNSQVGTSTEMRIFKVIGYKY